MRFHSDAQSAVHYAKGDTTLQSNRSHTTSVTLYVVPHCPLCAEARTWLRSHNIAYVERDVANDFGALRQMYKRTRQNLVPVFATEERVLVRPCEDELKGLLF